MKNVATHIVILLCAFVLAACGENSQTPLGLRQVEVAIDDIVTGSNTELGLKPDAINNTLLATAVKNGVPQAVAAAAFAKYDQFSAKVKKTDWVGAIDFTQDSAKSRFYMINTKTGAVEKTVVAHGSGSDPQNTGTPVKFSNTPNSLMTSLGAYIVNETFWSKEHHTAARLDGLESTNSYARARAVILHSATYVEQGRSKQGMSWGCPAVSMAMIATALKRFVGGGFLYAYGPAQTHAFLDEQRTQKMMMDPTFQFMDESMAPADGVGGD